MTWLLILALYNGRQEVTQLMPIATPFASWDACFLAGYRASGLDDLNLTPKPSAVTIRYECVPVEESRSTREICEERETARERLREEIRAVMRRSLGASKPAGEP